jgi:hypothetical protein
MRTESPEDAARNLWQSQMIEHSQLQVEELRARENDIRSRAEKEARIWYVRGALCFAFCAFNLTAGRHPITDRLAAAMFVVWGLGLIRRGNRLRKRLNPQRFSPDVVMRSCLEMYRKELEYARVFRPRRWEWLLVAMAIGSLPLTPQVEQSIAGAVNHPGLWITVLSLLAIGLIGIFAIFIPQGFRRIQKEIGELDALAKETK